MGLYAYKNFKILEFFFQILNKSLFHTVSQKDIWCLQVGQNGIRYACVESLWLLTSISDGPELGHICHLLLLVVVQVKIATQLAWKRGSLDSSAVHGELTFDILVVQLIVLVYELQEMGKVLRSLKSPCINEEFLWEHVCVV